MTTPTEEARAIADRLRAHLNNANGVARNGDSIRKALALVDELEATAPPDPIAWILDDTVTRSITFHPPLALSEVPNGEPLAWLISDGTEAYFNRDAAAVMSEGDPTPLYALAKHSTPIPPIK